MSVIVKLVKVGPQDQLLGYIELKEELLLLKLMQLQQDQQQIKNLRLQGMSLTLEETSRLDQLAKAEQEVIREVLDLPRSQLAEDIALWATTVGSSMLLKMKVPKTQKYDFDNYYMKFYEGCHVSTAEVAVDLKDWLE